MLFINGAKIIPLFACQRLGYLKKNFFCPLPNHPDHQVGIDPNEYYENNHETGFDRNRVQQYPFFL